MASRVRAWMVSGAGLGPSSPRRTRALLLGFGPSSKADAVVRGGVLLAVRAQPALLASVDAPRASCEGDVTHP